MKASAREIHRIRREFDRYHARDYRVKCLGCRRWMCMRPRGVTLLQRRASPNAGLCIECPLPGDKTDPLVLVAMAASGKVS